MRIALCVVSYAAGALGLFPGAAGAQEPSPPQRLLTLAEARALARSRSPDASAARHAVVAAHAVVTRSVPPHGIVAGNPARLIKTLA